MIRRNARRKPGPKAETPNPYPAGDLVPLDTLPADLLAEGARALRDYFYERRRELTGSSNEDTERAIKRISGIAEQALDRTSVGWWSARRREVVQESDEKISGLPKGIAAWFYYLRHVGPDAPTKRPQHGAMRVFHEGGRKLLKRYDKTSKEWTLIYEGDGWPTTVEGMDVLSQQTATLTYSFPSFRPRFEAAVRRMLGTANLGRVGRSGRTHYLACSVLAALLDTSPEVIHDRLNHHRRTRPRSPETQ